MTKQHFAALAEAMKAEKPAAHWNANKMVQWELDVKALAQVCARFNSRFDYDRFVEACGLNKVAA
jgi:hypothetical protein